MKQLNRKLGSKSGVSILFALLVFMVASMVSITIITAASTSVKRSSEHRKALQKELTLESAAMLIRRSVDEQKYEYKYKVLDDGEQQLDKKELSGLLKKELQDLVKKIQDEDTDGDGPSDILAGLEDADPAFVIQVDHSSFQNVNVYPFLVEYNHGIPDEDRDDASEDEETVVKKYYKTIFVLKLKDTDETMFVSFLVTYTHRTEIETIHDQSTDEEGNTTDEESSYEIITETMEWEFDRMSGTAGGVVE